eukprot:3379665-Amphidinium_carterae.1
MVGNYTWPILSPRFTDRHCHSSHPHTEPALACHCNMPFSQKLKTQTTQQHSNNKEKSLGQTSWPKSFTGGSVDQANV